ncbi:MAG: glycosyltransferase [Actinomycetota bacterium]
MPKVVITMPAYRAEGTLAQTVGDIPAGLADQLILVDDASTDNTAQLARDLGIRVFVHTSNQGYGGNQKTCYTMALKEGADVVVLLHPDYQYDPKAVPLLIAPILAGDADMTFGSRFAGLGDPRAGGMPIYRYLGNRITTILENLMLGSRFTEMHSGLRAYTRECLLSLPFLRYTDDFAFDSQLLVDAVTLGQRVVEVPIPTRYTKESSSIAVGPSFRYITRSLEYCARQTLARGRRGLRSPVVRFAPRHATAADQPALEPLPAPGDAQGAGADRGVDARPLSPETTGWVAGQMRGFVTTGKRLLWIGRPDPRFLDVAGASGWEASTASSLGGLEVSASVDAVVGLGVLEAAADPLDALRRLRAVLAGEGILVLSASGDPEAASRDGLGQAGLPPLLRRSGFRLVEWDAAPRSVDRARTVVVVARPS